MPKMLVAGCSYTSGYGFPDEKNEPGLWVNLLHRSLPEFYQCELVNIAKAGRSNQGIFQDAVWHLSRERYSYAIVAWTSMPRFEIDLGLELYATQQTFMANGAIRTHNLNGLTYSGSYLEGIRDRLVTLVHLHREIANLLHYLNSLINLAKLQCTKIFFVNSICPWDEDYFDHRTDIMPNQTTEFTQNTIIGLENRSDQDFFLIYDKIHQEYRSTGGIQEPYWLNLYKSLRQSKIDTNQDQVHPGLQSNLNYFNTFNQALQQMI